MAIALNSPRLRALRFYRLLIVLPYAMPSFAMLLVWRDMFNTDFGLINNLTGQSINWFGACGPPGSPCCSSSSGSATRTCSWSAWAPSSPSRRT